MATLSFSYKPPVSKQYIQHMNESEMVDLKENCQNTADCQVTVNTIKNNNNTEYNISLTGSIDNLMKVRGELLQNSPLEVKLTMKIPPIVNLKEELKKLELELNIRISIALEKKNYCSFISDNLILIEIIGIPAQVEKSRIRLLIMIDENMKKYNMDTIKIPLNLQYLICGRKRMSLLPIIEETSTNIYFPSPFHKDEDIYITGEPTNVSRVKDMLNKLAMQKAKSMYHKEISLYARKIDWLLLNCRDKLRKIMHDNGAYIEFPPIGSGVDRITVYAENRVNAERTLRAINYQSCQIYEACFYFNNQNYDPNGTHMFFHSMANLTNLIKELSEISSSEVIYKTESGCIEVLGSERSIRNVYQRLQEIPFLQLFHHYTVFRVESSVEQKDFISGKKNGKINKIMKTSGAKIKFMSYINDYNFLIEVESTSFTKALDGLTLLQEELPAEISFYVPESYHKRIIGVGGKNIQRIMKKYGVYVKFSNTEEFASLGGYDNNEDNVVARTPMKNQINLDNLRHAVMELIHPKDRNYITETINVPFYLHHDLIHHYTNFFQEEVVKKLNTQLNWPDTELGNSTIELLGPESNISLSIQIIETVIPEIYEFHFPCENEFYLQEIISKGSFKDKVVLELKNLEVTVEASYSEFDGCIQLKMTRDKNLKDVLKIVMDYFKAEEIKLYDGFTTLEELMEKKIPSTTSSTSTTSTTSSFVNRSYPFLNSNWVPPNIHQQSDNIRAIFDTPIDLMRYQRMSMPLPNTNDIWSSSTSRNRLSTPMFYNQNPTFSSTFGYSFPSRTTNTLDDQIQNMFDNFSINDDDTI